MNIKKTTAKDFEIIPGIGKKLSQELIDLGYRKVSELSEEDPEIMYQNLMALRDHHIDRCVLYVFRCAVYFASHSTHEAKLLKWWSWKDKNESN